MYRYKDYKDHEQLGECNLGDSYFCDYLMTKYNNGNILLVFPDSVANVNNKKTRKNCQSPLMFLQKFINT